MRGTLHRPGTAGFNRDLQATMSRSQKFRCALCVGGAGSNPLTMQCCVVAEPCCVIVMCGAWFACELEVLHTGGVDVPGVAVVPTAATRCSMGAMTTAIHILLHADRAASRSAALRPPVRPWSVPPPPLAPPWPHPPSRCHPPRPLPRKRIRSRHGHSAAPLRAPMPPQPRLQTPAAARRGPRPRAPPRCTPAKPRKACSARQAWHGARPCSVRHHARRCAARARGGLALAA